MLEHSDAERTGLTCGWNVMGPNSSNAVTTLEVKLAIGRTGDAHE